MTKSQFRATTPDDAGQVSDLLRRVFHLPPNAVITEPKHLYWKNWEPRPDWSGSRGYVTERDGVAIAHGTVIPLNCVVNSQRFRMVHGIDWAGDPAVVGSGVAHMRKFTTIADGIFAVGGSDMAEKALPALGFKSFGLARRFSRPTHPLQRAGGQKLSTRLLAQVGRSALWSVQAPNAPLHGFRAERLSEAELLTTRVPMPTPVEGLATFERSPEVFSYLLKCPALPVEFYAVSRNGVRHGYFVLAHAPGQVRLADFWINSVQQADWNAAVQLAVTEARKNSDTAEIVAMASDDRIVASLTANGFHDRGSFHIRVLMAKGLEFPNVPIRWHMLDNDVFWLHEHNRDYWA